MLLVYSEGGPAAIRNLLVDWLLSWRGSVADPGRDYRPALSEADVFPCEQFLGARLTVQVHDKVARDDLCRQLHLSPSRQQHYPSSRVTARLTAHENRNRVRVLEAFMQAGDSENRSLAGRAWVPGRRVQIAADVATVITENAPSFRISLGLSEASVMSLI